MALKPAFGEHGLPVERLSGGDMRNLLKLPGMASHPAVARILAASLDMGPAWPQVLSLERPVPVARLSLPDPCVQKNHDSAVLATFDKLDTKDYLAFEAYFCSSGLESGSSAYAVAGC